MCASFAVLVCEKHGGRGRQRKAEGREVVAACGWKRGMKRVNERQTLLLSGSEFLGQTSLTCKISPLVLPLSGFSL